MLKFLKSKLSTIDPNKDNNKVEHNDNFIIQHVQNNKTNHNGTIQIQDLPTLDPRRLVFVSLIGLYQSWRRISDVSLYTALLLIPLKKVWIYQPMQYINELKSSFVSHVTVYGDINETKQFMELLKWKDSQGLVMWILDYFDEFGNSIPVAIKTVQQHDINPLIASFWYSLNDKLCALYDHITGSNYSPLHFDEKWWKNKKKFTSKYDTKASQILSEYYFVTMKYNSMSEIIWQSNPKSLHPVITYKNRSNTKCFSPIRVGKGSNSNKTAFGFNVNKICVISPLSPIKEKQFSVDDEKRNSCVLDNRNPYLQVIKESKSINVSTNAVNVSDS